MFCSKCGKEIPDNSKFCVHCGTPVMATPPVQNTQTVQMTPPPVQPQNTVQQPVYPGYTQTGMTPIIHVTEEKKSKTGLIIVLLIVILLLALLCGYLFGRRSPANPAGSNTPSATAGTVETLSGGGSSSGSGGGSSGGSSGGGTTSSGNSGGGSSSSGSSGGGSSSGGSSGGSSSGGSTTPEPEKDEIKAVWTQQPDVKFDAMGLIEYPRDAAYDYTYTNNMAGIERTGYPTEWCDFTPAPAPGTIAYRNGDILTIASFDRKKIILSVDTGKDHGMPAFNYLGSFFQVPTDDLNTVYLFNNDLTKVEKRALPPMGGVTIPVSISGGRLVNEGGYPISDSSGRRLVYFADDGSISICKSDGYVISTYTGANAVYQRGVVNNYFVSSPDGKSNFSLVNINSGKTITKTAYDDVKYFTDGYCAVKKGGKWGFIEISGEEVTDFIWDDVTPLFQGETYVCLNGVYGVLHLEKSLMAAGGKLTAQDCYGKSGKPGAGSPPTGTPKPSTVSEAVIGTVKVKVTDLNSRSIPSTSGTKMGKVIMDQTYDVYEFQYAEGYTWYRIDTNRWIADKSGLWLDFTSK